MMTKPTNDQMNRGEFLRNLGMGSAALMAFYCMGTGLTACSKGGSDPAPSPGATGGFTGNADPTKGTVNFTIDLADSNYSKLTTIGSYVYQNDIIIAHAKDGSYIAVSKLCTHQQQNIRYVLNDVITPTKTEDDFYCDTHGSRFNNNGSVKNGPAATALQQFKTSLNADGTKLTIAA